MDAEQGVREVQVLQFHQPQLAKRWTVDKVRELDLRGYAVEVKFDGHRLLMGRDVAWSRLGNPHRNEYLQRFVPEGVLLDGELVPRDGSGSHVVGHLRSESPESLVFVAFDILYVRGFPILGCPWKDRRKTLTETVHKIYDAGGEEAIRLSPMFNASSEEQFKGIWDMVERDQLEGLILKKVDVPYKPNSRSAWLKVKVTETYDVVIVDCEGKPTEWTVRPGCYGADGVLYPEGKHAAKWGSAVNLRYGFYDMKGKLRVVGSLGYTGPRDELEKKIGCVVELKSFGPQYETGALRHPGIVRWRDRDEKAATDCVFDFKE